MLSRAYGIARSLAMYYGQPWKAPRRRAFYRQFIAPGAVCFDIGAHVGNRIGAWLRLGAHVVAVEPQPDCMRVLRALYGRHPKVTLLDSAVGERAGVSTLHVSSRTPTVSSFSKEWMDEVTKDKRFASIEWDQSLQVKIETLDDLIRRYGTPAFCKIDVEGFEFDVLKGLSEPLPALSLEYIPVSKERAVQCVYRLGQLGDYRYRPSAVETMEWSTADWLTTDQMVQYLNALKLEAGSGDVYARLQTAK